MDHEAAKRLRQNGLRVSGHALQAPGAGRGNQERHHQV